MKENRLNAGFGRAMMSPYRIGEDGEYLRDASGEKILMYLPLGGYGNNRKRLCLRGRAEATQARVFDRDLAFEYYSSCVAYQDETGKLLLHFSCDTIRVFDEYWAEVKQILQEKLGVDPDRVFCTATHTHSGVDFFEFSRDPFTDSDGRVSSCAENNAVMKTILIRAMVKSAEEAVQDMAPVTALRTGTVKAVRPDGICYNYVREYPLVAKDDREFSLGCFGPNFNDSFRKERFLANGRETAAEYYMGLNGELPEESRSHMSAANHDILLRWIEREGKKPLALCNFRAHATVQSGDLSVVSRYGVRERQHYSPDFVGPFRDAVEHEMDCLCVFYQGECGNINPKSYHPQEQQPELVRHKVPIFDAEDKPMGTADIPNDFAVYGQGLASFVIRALKDRESLMDALGDGRIMSAHEYHPVPFRSGEYYTEIDDKALGICRDMVDYFKAYYGTDRYELANINAMARAAGGTVHSYYHANNVISRRAVEPHLQPVELAVYRIGGAAVAMSPSEMFDTDGDIVKAEAQRAGFADTIVCGYSNNYEAYIPSELGFTEGKTVEMAGNTKGSYVKADGTVVEFDAPTKGMFGCYEADQCRLAPVYGAGNQPLYGVYDGSDGVHQAGDPVYVGEYLAHRMGEMLKSIL